jgi:hypothetical protein
LAVSVIVDEVDDVRSVSAKRSVTEARTRNTTNRSVIRLLTSLSNAARGNAIGEVLEHGIR